jgi:hypothetical protein
MSNYKAYYPYFMIPSDCGVIVETSQDRFIWHPPTVLRWFGEGLSAKAGGCGFIQETEIFMKCTWENSGIVFK